MKNKNDQVKDAVKSTDVPEDIDSFYEKIDGVADEDEEAIKNLQLLAFEVSS